MLVTGVTYRHPGLLAKIVSTLDVLCDGRALLGLGAAWYEREHQALGVPFPPVAERFERLEETLRIVRQMWSEDDGPFLGKHYQLAETINVPQPLGPVPIMIGGGGERKTLRLVAKYADATNLFAGERIPPEAIQAKLAVLARHCEREEVDYDQIRKTILWAAPLNPDAAGGAEFVQRMAAYARVGIEEVHVMPPTGDPVGFIENLGRHVVPGLREVTPPSPGR
jgi:alkanesulfonate monooxygenase SsuD/methylene tetrahydromethanopterin reductase-like flavin-dependent oxidoreductase (luciferase family)